MTRRIGRYKSNFRRAISDGHVASNQQQANITHQAPSSQHVGGRRFAAVPEGECKRPNIWQLWGWPPQYVCAPPRLAGQGPRPQAQSSSKRTRRRKRTRIRRRR